MEDRLACPPAEHTKASCPKCKENSVDHEVESRVEAHAAVQDNRESKGGYREKSRCTEEDEGPWRFPVIMIQVVYKV